jgi:hypothetical protein
MREAIASMVSAYSGIRVQGAVFAPADDAGDCLAADVEPTEEQAM